MTRRPTRRVSLSGARMTDDVQMRVQLQRVAVYRELCRAVRRTGRENVVFAAIMGALAYISWQAGANKFVLAIYAVLIGCELAVGFFKWAFPSAEGPLLDGLVLLLFAVVNFGFQLLAAQAGRPLNPVIILFGLLLLAQAVNRFRFYGHLRRLFADRPSPEHIAWFDGLAAEIRAADPQADDLALDLPTGPQWKVKLLGGTAFFVGRRGGAVWVAGPDDFELLREKADHGTGRRRAMLKVFGHPYPEFEIADATWANYQRWRATYPLPQPAPAAGA